MRKRILIYTPTKTLTEFEHFLTEEEIEIHKFDRFDELLDYLSMRDANNVVVTEAFVNGGFSVELASEYVHKNDFFIIYEGDQINTIRQILSMGAKDCLTRPISPGEIFVKVEKALKTNPALKAFTVLDFPPELTLKQAQIYELLKGRGKIGVERAEFVEILWRGEKVTKKVVDVHLSNLRKKVQKYGQKIVMNDSKKWILTSESSL